MFYFISAWVGSLYISLAYIFGPLVTGLNNRFGFRTTAIAGGLILSVSLLASSFVDNFWIFFMLFSIMAGLGSGMSYHSSLLVVLRHFVKWRSLGGWNNGIDVKCRHVCHDTNHRGTCFQLWT